ncbi:hypothetical protein PMKS-000724 [Pichia membranifaciens]|uniref:Exonuclease V, mitochondrial n=1 Tax=Pichia membranifaciens TaxID=4926 RepID=A0A1Q2YCJ4_9ASCO|nr:hypothetical protein PMKS-000724 [Pichia membranifaciens]
MHTLKVRVPIPRDLQERKLAELKAFREIRDETLKGKSAKYSDEEVYLRISKLGKSSSAKEHDVPEPTGQGEFEGFSLPVPKSIKNSRNPLNERIDALADYLSCRKNTKHLPSKFITSRKLIPYDELCQVEKNDNARLSVTKILPHAYCELKDMYQLYLGGIRVQTQAMKDGKKIHQVLEESIHPQIDLCLETLSGEDEIVRIDKSTNLYELKPARETMTGIDTMTTGIDTLQIQSESEHATLYQQPTTMKAPAESKTLDTEEKRMKYLKENYNIEDTTGDVVENSKEAVVLDEQEAEEDQIQMRPIDAEVTTEIEAEKEANGELIVLKLINSELIAKSQVHKIAQTIRRLINLFEFGQGREILVHALYDRKNEKLLTEIPTGKDFSPNDCIIISGIIDDLHLTSDHEDAFGAFQRELQDELKEAFDFEETFTAIKNKTKQWTDTNDPMLYLVVNDDKSRSDKRKPSPRYQKTQLLQVGMYRKFLGILSKDVNFTYESWRYNMECRKESLDSPLDNTLVSFSYFVNHFLLNDYIKLKRGEPLEFTGISRPPLQTAERSTMPYVFKNSTNVKELDVLVGEWVYPPTLAHILGRLAQTQCLLNDFLSDKLQVSYVSRSTAECLNTVPGKYDGKFVSEQIGEGMDLWMGKREPSSTNYEQACNYCDFKNKCEIPDRLKGLL